MKTWQIILWTTFCVAAGMTAGVLQHISLRDWYPYLARTLATPPEWVFPVAWVALYVMMGVATSLVRMKARAGRGIVTGIFIAELVVNFLWFVAFLYLRPAEAGLVVTTVLLVLLLVYVWRSYSLNLLAVYLLLPGVAWLGFAWCLHFFVTVTGETP